jgi:hypothetical protein
MAYTFLTSSKIANLISLFAKVFTAFTISSHPLQNQNTGRCTPNRPEVWQHKMEQIFRRTSSNLPNCKERRMLANILPLVHTNGPVKILTLFLPGLALLQSPRTKRSIA